MNFFEKRKLKTLLQSCNFMLAGEIIKSKFASMSGQNALTELIEDYMADPGIEMAVKLIDFEPQLTIYFVECNPDGFYTRQMQKRMIDTQEHQAFVSHLSVSYDAKTEMAAASGKIGKAVHEKERQNEHGGTDASDLLPPRSRAGKREGAASQPADFPAPMAVRQFPNVIQTLQDSVRELHQQVIECEQEVAELEKRGSGQAEIRRKWLAVCKDGIKEFETAIRVLRTAESDT